MRFSNNSHCILLVDDNARVIQIVSRILEKAGCDVTAVMTGKDALKKLETEAYDVLIFDVRLQDMNGLDLLEKIQKNASNMRKIVLTGYPSDEDKIRAIKQGADHYIAKPIKPEKLIDIIKQTVN